MANYKTVYTPFVKKFYTVSRREINETGRHSPKRTHHLDYKSAKAEADYLDILGARTIEVIEVTREEENNNG
jgi:hypothetical protein